MGGRAQLSPNVSSGDVNWSASSGLVSQGSHCTRAWVWLRLSRVECGMRWQQTSCEVSATPPTLMMKVWTVSASQNPSSTGEVTAIVCPDTVPPKGAILRVLAGCATICLGRQASIHRWLPLVEL